MFHVNDRELCLFHIKIDYKVRVRLKNSFMGGM